MSYHTAKCNYLHKHFQLRTYELSLYIFGYLHHFCTGSIEVKTTSYASYYDFNLLLPVASADS